MRRGRCPLRRRCCTVIRRGRIAWQALYRWRRGYLCRRHRCRLRGISGNNILVNGCGSRILYRRNGGRRRNRLLCCRNWWRRRLNGARGRCRCGWRRWQRCWWRRWWWRSSLRFGCRRRNRFLSNCRLRHSRHFVCFTICCGRGSHNTRRRRRRNLSATQIIVGILRAARIAIFLILFRRRGCRAQAGRYLCSLLTLAWIWHNTIFISDQWRWQRAVRFVASANILHPSGGVRTGGEQQQTACGHAEADIPPRKFSAPFCLIRTMGNLHGNTAFSVFIHNVSKGF